ncbi:cyclic-di-AMP-binding protein CbpB [Bacillus daqingensis]|uniref:Cyclic-di-AMP-binding protein CbpB n=1 Tax=Bacillus daqingensis TaxID=872396 RepID=A0ABV9NXH3_9BACI
MPNIQETDVLSGRIDTFIVPAEQVANVQPDHSLEHALLVLVKSGYTAIPVLNIDTQLVGIISKAKILDSILGIERMEPERLNNYLVKDVMNEDFVTVHEDARFERVINQSIEYPFVCVQNSSTVFKGIIPRSKILAHLNGYLHELRRTCFKQDED